MKRDLNLVRKILFKMEAEEELSTYNLGSVEVDGYSEQQVNYHMKIMAQAGLLHVDVRELPSPIDTQWEIPKAHISCYSISWNGHEFLSAASDNARWEKAKNAMEKAGGYVLPILMQLLTQYIKAELKLP
jgi:hypothetical protein